MLPYDMTTEEISKASNLTNIVDTSKHLGYSVFCETGIGGGYTVQHLLDTQNFSHYYTCDVVERLVEAARKWWDGDPVTIYHDTSINAIPLMLDQIGDLPTFWWLDAHYSSQPIKEDGVVVSVGSYSMEDGEVHQLPVNESIQNEIPLPLELELLFDARAHLKNDIIICDDLKIYMDIGQQDTPAISQIRHSDFGLQNKERLESVLDKWRETGDYNVHTIEDRKGYIIIEPKCRDIDFLTFNG